MDGSGRHVAGEADGNRRRERHRRRDGRRGNIQQQRSFRARSTRATVSVLTWTTRARQGPATQQAFLFAQPCLGVRQVSQPSAVGLVLLKLSRELLGDEI